MKRYIDMLESIKNEMEKEIKSYPMNSIRRNLLLDYFHEISEIQDKIIPGSSDKKHTIEFLAENKDKIELSNEKLQNEDNNTFTVKQMAIINKRDDAMITNKDLEQFSINIENNK